MPSSPSATKVKSPPVASCCSPDAMFSRYTSTRMVIDERPTRITRASSATASPTRMGT
ncbi:hypothetical protein ACXXDK_10935 [Deinococcus sp. PESE-38]